MEFFQCWPDNFSSSLYCFFKILFYVGIHIGMVVSKPQGHYWCMKLIINGSVSSTLQLPPVSHLYLSVSRLHGYWMTPDV